MICRNQEDMIILRARLQALLKIDSNMRIGITSGCFDLLHPLHVLFLEKCKRECDFLVVFVDSDDLINTNKNRNPIFNERDRAYMIESLTSVDSTVTMYNYLSIADFVHPFVYKNTIKMFKNSNKVYGKEVVTFGCQLVVIPDVIVPESSTEIRKILNL